MTHRRTKHATIFAVCLLSVLFAYAGPKDFWETKPYTEWSAKEVEKLLLKDSPWTQTLLLDTPTSGGGAITSTGGDKGGSRGGGGGGEVSQKIIINWFARPIREATARQLMLQKADTPKAQLNTILNRNAQFMELLVTGLTMGRGRGGGGEEELTKFKESTFLQKKNSEKIPIANMLMPRSRNEAIVLQFAREIDGKPAITSADQEVTFVIRIGEKTYKFKFKLADMMVSNKLET